MYVSKPLFRRISRSASKHPSSASEMTYIVSSGALNSTHSLTHQYLFCSLLYSAVNPTIAAGLLNTSHGSFRQ